jgi:hypothetical protein
VALLLFVIPTKAGIQEQRKEDFGKLGFIQGEVGQTVSHWKHIGFKNILYNSHIY